MEMKDLCIGDLVAKLPIVQGGMGVGISLSGLASAVANQGGIGVIATAGIGMNEPDFFTDYLEANIRALKKEIRIAREKSSGILGANIMVALSNFSDMVKTAVEEKVDVIFSGAGLPLNLPEYVKETTKTKLVPIISSARAATIIAKKWIDKYDYIPDAFVVEGPKAGGHLGFKLNQLDDPGFSLEVITEKVMAAVKVIEEKCQKHIPVIVGGGIYSGQDIRKFLEMGVDGVQMATRFVTTEECDADLRFKEAYLNAAKEDMTIIKSPVGLPGRAINNDFLRAVASGNKTPFSCPYNCIRTCDYKNSPYCIIMALINAQRGRLKNGFVFAGANAYRSDKIVSVEELINTLKAEGNFLTAT